MRNNGKQEGSLQSKAGKALRESGEEAVKKLLNNGKQLVNNDLKRREKTTQAADERSEERQSSSKTKAGDDVVQSTANIEQDVGHQRGEVKVGGLASSNGRVLESHGVLGEGLDLGGSLDNSGVDSCELSGDGLASSLLLLERRGLRDTSGSGV